MKLIHSHCHFDDFHKTGEVEAVLMRASDAMVEHFVAIGTSLRDLEINHHLAKHFSNIDYAVGVHTLYHDNPIPDFGPDFGVGKLLVAIGEIGLDYHSLPPDSSDKVMAPMKRMFVSQLPIAKEHDLLVGLPSRDAFDDTTAFVEESGMDGTKMLFHCYECRIEEMRIINEFGA